MRQEIRRVKCAQVSYFAPGWRTMYDIWANLSAGINGSWKASARWRGGNVPPLAPGCADRSGPARRCSPVGSHALESLRHGPRIRVRPHRGLGDPDHPGRPRLEGRRRRSLPSSKPKSSSSGRLSPSTLGWFFSTTFSSRAEALSGFILLTVISVADENSYFE